MNYVLSIGISVAFFLTAQLAFAATGEQIFNTSCASCHGADNTMLTVPILHGQEPAFIRAALKSFKDDTRIDNIMGSMNALAKTLSDDDIKAVATYLAGQDLCDVKQEIDHEAPGFMDKFKAGAKLSEEKNCMHCHASFHHLAPRLYGQKKEFVSISLNAFRDGSRKNPMMNRFTANMTDEEIDQLSTYFNGMKLMRTCEE